MNKFSWNYDRSYLLQVMIGNFYGVPDHNQVSFALFVS